MARYTSKPTEIEAVQWMGSWPPVEAFAGPKVRPFHAPDGKGHVEDRLMLLAGVDGAQDWVPVPVGHWLVCQPGDKSHLWPVDPEYFANKYELKEQADVDDAI